jgi:transaldolase
VVIYLDGADLKTMRELEPLVQGFTTNPSLMKKAGITNYQRFIGQALREAKDKPISFEVIADDISQMESQARVISSMAPNIYVKIPVTNTKGESTAYLCRKLNAEGMKLNVTAVFTFEQITTVCRSLWKDSIISIFCGRIADAGLNPMNFITKATMVRSQSTKILWASTREVFNVKQARMAGADIITLTPELVNKLPLDGKNLTEYSLETVKQFYKDAEGIEF